MNNPMQHWNWILGRRRRAAGAALVLAILLVPAVIATPSAQAQSYGYRLVYSFTGANTANPSASDGANPYAGLVMDALGNLYGTTLSGGSIAAQCRSIGATGCGTVFKISPNGSGGWTETVLYSFTKDSTTNTYTGLTCYDGATPYGGLALGSGGNLFGTTSQGGIYGEGTVFEVTPGTPPVLNNSPCYGQNLGSTWTEVALASFDGVVNGATPQGGLVLDGQGNMYGTNYNTVFKVDPIGQVTTLYNFSLNPYDSQGNTNGTDPGASLVRLAGNNLFGTTLNGGDNGSGTAFELTAPDYSTETGIIQFGNGDQYGITDGAQPMSGLAGRSLKSMFGMYGTTFAGGANGYGTVYETDSLGDETVLYAFTGGVDGGGPVGGLVRDKKGNYYGTTTSGGAYGHGTVFMVSPVSVANDVYKETTLYSFTGGADGGGPTAGLVQDAQGNLYGTTNNGGVTAGACKSTYGCGTVFQMLLLPTTTTTLSTSGSPAALGAQVTFTATVVSETCTPTPPCTPPNGEQVNFTIMSRTTLSTVASGPGTLSGGQATFSISTLPLGTYLVTAAYPGDMNLAGSASTALNQGVSKATTTTGLTSSLNPSLYGQPVTFTATVAPEYIGTPTGTVTFKNGTATLGTVALSGGVAVFTPTKLLAVGTDSITATYNGSTSFTPSTSTPVSQIVSQASTTTTLASSLNPSAAKQSVKFTAMVAPQFSGTPTGTVTFYDNNGATFLGTVNLNAKGVAAYATKMLTSGTHNITATYNGDNNFTGSTSAVLTQTVN